MKLFIKNYLFIVIFLAISCNKKEISYNYPDNQDYARNSRAGSFLDENLILYGAKDKKESQNEINKKDAKSIKIWKATIEVVGSLFPIAIIDENSSIIVSEWHQQNDKNKRIKINAFVKEDSVKITIFRQKRLNEKQNWESDGIEDSDDEKSGLTAKLIKEKILQKALVR